MGDTGASQTVSVAGANFLPGAVAKITGTGIAVRSTTFVSSTVLSLTVDIADRVAVASYDASVLNPDGSVATCGGCFAVAASDVILSD